MIDEQVREQERIRGNLRPSTELCVFCRPLFLVSLSSSAEPSVATNNGRRRFYLSAVSGQLSASKTKTKTIGESHPQHQTPSNTATTGDVCSPRLPHPLPPARARSPGNFCAAQYPGNDHPTCPARSCRRGKSEQPLTRVLF